MSLTTKQEHVTTTCALCMISKRHKQHRFHSASPGPRALCLCLASIKDIAALPRLCLDLSALTSASASTKLPWAHPCSEVNVKDIGVDAGQHGEDRCPQIWIGWGTNIDFSPTKVSACYVHLCILHCGIMFNCLFTGVSQCQCCYTELRPILPTAKESGTAA